ncbi:50S ribosomal protein L24 [Anatilimnocola aggregata]|uniref:Large ribosomal subunit protein uL24 n=1 Tax=Anatilimnocola aggregata TaxID=2528021 RepID=A0A517YJR6_9BACT|nr:50S ribosomal protein L24 [Anatilimnocola aggregata]QDU30465.1 50S ribosomal protein L24 [Anatilimnocola aggregata]
MHIRTNDIVQVIAGDEKDVKGKVLHIDREAGRITVEGVNRVYKHVRRSQRNPQGGRLSKEMPVQISNVLLVCPKCNKGVRTGVKVLENGTKQRVCRKCDASLGDISKSKKTAAAK